MSEDYRLKIYKSNRLETFLSKVYPIIEKLAKEAPLQKKEIVIQSNGMARWLTLKVTKALGSFANFNFTEPDKFLRNFAVEHFGIDPDSFYNKKKAQWALYSLFKSEKDSPAASYIGGNDSKAFRFSQILADLFEQYFVYRPKMMECWLNGKTMTKNPDELWQFEIFRKLAEKTEVQGFAQLFNKKCQTAPKNGSYPKELILFGISIMNRYHLNMFMNLSRLFPIHLFTITPSKEFIDSASKKKGDFEDISEEKGFSNTPLDTFFRRFCAAELDFVDFVADNLPDEIDLFEEPSDSTLLSSIQLDILKDMETPIPAELDDSVKIISCRDKMREIEVLKDILLELFKDKTLKPEDIAVMAPKINDYAPFISAVFGGTDPQDKDNTFIPYEISDRAFSSESRIAATFLEMLKLAKSDFEKSKVLAIFNSPSVRAKFNTDAKTVGEIEELIDKSGIRWGLDANSRERKNGQNTWDYGLSRIMMSFFLPFTEKGESFENILPMEHISKEDLDNISGFITFARELFGYLKEFRCAEKSPKEFKNLLKEMLDSLFAFDKNDKTAKEEVAHIRTIIDDFAETAEKYVERISFDAILHHLDDELGRDRSTKGFWSAKVNFCSLKPLRALPFKVIFIIGMGDGEFPRNENRYAFDLSKKKPAEENDAPQPRSVRDNDKYLFAEALISAREKLFISYAAKDLSADSKKRRSAAMPVRILEKYIEKKTKVKSEKLEKQYPAQPYSSEYFEANSEFRTFSRKDFDIAHEMFHVKQNQQNPHPKEVSEEKQNLCEECATEIADLEKLVSFFKDPTSTYFKKNLHAVFPDDSKGKSDEELFGYSEEPLLTYSVCKTYLDMAQSIHEEFAYDYENFEKTFINRIKCEGNIPFGSFGEASLKSLIETKKLNEIARIASLKDPVIKPISINFEELQTKLEGVVKNIKHTDINSRMILAFTSKFQTKYKIEALIRHFAANAGGIEVDTNLVCCDKSVLLKHLDSKEAKSNLSVFLKLWKSAKKEMPLYDPELIDEFQKKIDECQEKISTYDVKECVKSFFEKKWLKRNDQFSFLSQGFLLATEQFLNHGQQEYFLEQFPVDEVLEIASLLSKFYPSKKRR